MANLDSAIDYISECLVSPKEAQEAVRLAREVGMIRLEQQDQIDLYNQFDWSYTVTEYKVDGISYDDIVRIAEFLRNRDYV